MTNVEILTKAIQKAIAGGLNEHTFHSLPISAFHIDLEVGILGKLFSDDGEEIDVATIVFNHDFALSLWGEELHPYNATKAVQVAIDQGGGKVLVPEALPNWQFHLQQMVVADDPLDYLGKNI